jgi:hypothetical protein
MIELKDAGLIQGSQGKILQQQGELGDCQRDCSGNFSKKKLIISIVYLR